MCVVESHIFMSDGLYKADTLNLSIALNYYNNTTRIKQKVDTGPSHKPNQTKNHISCDVEYIAFSSVSIYCK